MGPQELVLIRFEIGLSYYAIGKTSTILALARQIYGPQMFKSRVLELNASDERGISVIREKVKNFARTTLSTGDNAPANMPPFKIVILDEADSMTVDAQSALRRTMETYSKMTRFCLVCNYVSRIIEPVASRCAKFRFKPLESGAATARLDMICQREGIQCNQQVLKWILDASEGDLRRAIMYLQSASSLFSGRELSVESMAEMVGVIPDSIIRQFISIVSGETARVDQAEQWVNGVMAAGYPLLQFIIQLQDHILMPSAEGTESGAISWSSNHKSLICRKIAEVEKRCVDGASEFLQYFDLVLSCREILSQQ